MVRQRLELEADIEQLMPWNYPPLNGTGYALTDNPVMQEIVEQLWSAKQKRQIVFVSHNANLVVNGDAELVVWCDYRKVGDQSGGKVAGEGAIDVPEVRGAIKRIMEGGEAAFNLRREKYGF